MVFLGRFSRGCMRCKQRKLKCDENEPSCRRCYIYGKPCPGYTNQSLFRRGLANKAETARSGSGPSTISSGNKRSSNSITTPFQITNEGPRVPRSRKKAAATGPVAKNAEDATDGDAANGTGETKAKINNSNDDTSLALKTTSSAQKPSITSHISISQDWVSLCYFIGRFVSPDGFDCFPGHLKFLPMLYDQHRQGPLEMAGLSVAQMATYNAFGSNFMRLQSYQNFGRAVKYLQQSIQDVDSATDDKVLATVLLLCTFKDLSGEGLGDPSEHVSGLYYLLEKRGPGQLVNRQGMELFLFSLLRLVHAFSHEDDKYIDPGGLATFFGARDPLLRAMSMMCRILQLRHTLFAIVDTAMHAGLQHHQQQQQQQQSPAQQSLPQQSQYPQQQLPPNPEGNVAPKSEHTSWPKSPMDPYIDTTAVQSCFEVLEDFDEWDADAPSYWRSTFEDRTAPASLGDFAFLQLHYDVETACVIILIRSARLILLHGMVDYHARMQMATAGEYGRIGGGLPWNDCVPALEQDIRSTISDMLWCVPYALGDVDHMGKMASIQSDGAGALVILQSMRLVTYCRLATQEQKLAAQSILNRMNITIGVRSAISWDEEVESKANLAAFQGLTVSNAAFTSPSTFTPPPPQQHFQ